MNDPLQGYRGKIIRTQPAGHAERPAGEALAEPSADEVMAQARNRADELLERARAEARQDYHETLVGRLLEIVAHHRDQILASREPLFDMAVRAVETIIGEMPEAERHKRAFEQAMRSFADGKRLVIRAASDVYPRYKIIALGANGGRNGRVVELVEDKGMAAGRCLVEADGRTYDVDAAAQVAAFSRAARRIAQGEAGK